MVTVAAWTHQRLVGEGKGGLSHGQKMDNCWEKRVFVWSFWKIRRWFVTEVEVVAAGRTSHADCLFVRIHRPRRLFNRVYRHVIIWCDQKLKKWKKSACQHLWVYITHSNDHWPQRWNPRKIPLKLLFHFIWNRCVVNIYSNFHFVFLMWQFSGKMTQRCVNNAWKLVT